LEPKNALVHDFVLKYTKKSGVATPGPPRRKGIHLFAPPMPTCQMLVPPPLLLGWLRPCRQVNSALFF